MNEHRSMSEIADKGVHIDGPVTGLKPSEMQQYAWRYFELHANQRMSVFKFFIGLATFLTASLLAAFIEKHYIASTLVGVLLGLVSFVFSRLDARIRFLIKGSERALEDLEAIFLPSDADPPCRLKLFSQERMETSKVRGPLTTYRQCLNALFITFAMIGLLMGAISLCKSIC